MSEGTEVKVWSTDTSFTLTGTCPTDTNHSEYKSSISNNVTVTHGPNWPKFRERLRQGLQCTTLLEVSGTEYVCEPGLLQIEHNCVLKNRHARLEGRLCRDTTVVPAPFSTALLGEADDLAMAFYLRSIKGTYQGFSSGMFLGELGETIRMIKGPAYALRKGVRDYLLALKKRRRGVTSRKILLDVLTGTWLEYSFGWRPFMRDIEDGMAALQRYVVNEPARRYVKGIGVSSVPYTDDGRTYKAVYGLCVWLHKMRKKQECVVIYRGMVKARPDLGKDTLAGNSKYWGYHFEDFLPTFWELLPYSWLIDYFTNVGDIINGACTGTAGVQWTGRTQIKRGWSEMTNVRFDYDVWNLSYSRTCGPAKVQLEPGKWVAEVKSISRAPYDGALIPGFRFRMPRHTSQWINIAAVGIPRLYSSLVPFHKFARNP